MIIPHEIDLPKPNDLPVGEADALDELIGYLASHPGERGSAPEEELRRHCQQRWDAMDAGLRALHERGLVRRKEHRTEPMPSGLLCSRAYHTHTRNILDKLLAMLQALLREKKSEFDGFGDRDLLRHGIRSDQIGLAAVIIGTFDLAMCLETPFEEGVDRFVWSTPPARTMTRFLIMDSWHDVYKDRREMLNGEEWANEQKSLESRMEEQQLTMIEETDGMTPSEMLSLRLDRLTQLQPQSVVDLEVWAHGTYPIVVEHYPRHVALFEKSMKVDSVAQVRFWMTEEERRAESLAVAQAKKLAFIELLRRLITFRPADRSDAAPASISNPPSSVNNYTIQNVGNLAAHGSTASGTVTIYASPAQPTQEEYRKPLAIVREAVGRDDDAGRLPPEVADALTQMLRLLREIQVEGKSVADSANAIRSMAEDSWAKSAAAGMTLPGGLEVIRVIQANPLLLPIAKAVFGLP